MKRFLLIPIVLLCAGCVSDKVTEFSGRAVDVSKYQVHGATAEYDTPPILLSARMPEYPLVARVRHELAVVTVEFVVGVDGRAHDVQVLKSPPQTLAYATTQALTEWRWTPAQKNGKDVPAHLSFSMDFFRG